MRGGHCSECQGFTGLLTKTPGVLYFVRSRIHLFSNKCDFFTVQVSFTLIDFHLVSEVGGGPVKRIMMYVGCRP